MTSVSSERARLGSIELSEPEFQNDSRLTYTLSESKFHIRSPTPPILVIIVLTGTTTACYETKSLKP